MTIYGIVDRSVLEKKENEESLKKDTGKRFKKFKSKRKGSTRAIKRIK